METRRLSASIIGLVLLSFIFFGCEQDPSQQLCDGIPRFDIDRFVSEVSQRMNDPANPVSGYQFVLVRDGNVYHEEAEGFSVHGYDRGGPELMTVNTRMNVASVSKFIGTIALMQVLEEKGIGLDDMVIPHLPDTFQQVAYPDFTNPASDAYLTFRKLLRMETAINFPGDDPHPGEMLTEAEMLQGIANRINTDRIGKYQNANFTLIRVLIGELEYGLDATADDYATACTDKYFEYIKQRIFDPLGISPPMSAQAVEDYYKQPNYTLGYRYPFDSIYMHPVDGTLGWRHYSNPYRNGGSGGLILSARDIAKVAAFFRHDPAQTIMSTANRDLILENELGLIESSSSADEKIRFKAKGGTRGPEDSPGLRALFSHLMFFPDGVEAVLLSNCNIDKLHSILRDSYEAAIVDC